MNIKNTSKAFGKNPLKPNSEGAHYKAMGFKDLIRVSENDQILIGNI
jgi:hypothetical protein